MMMREHQHGAQCGARAGYDPERDDMMCLCVWRERRDERPERRRLPLDNRNINLIPSTAVVQHSLQR